MALDKFQPYLFVSAGEQSNKFLTPVISPDGIASFQAQRAQDLTGLTVRIDPIQADAAAASAASAAASAETAEDAAAQVLSSRIVTDASGSIASFSDGADDVAVKSLVATITPVQNLNGQANPYPAGGGINKIALSDGIDFTLNGVHYYTKDGNLYFDGTSVGETSSTNPVFSSNLSFVLPAGTYYFSRMSYSNAAYLRSDSGSIVTNNGTFTLSESTTVWLAFYIYNQTFNNEKVPCMLVNGSTAPSSYAPFSNIRPISGRTGLTVTRAGRNILKLFDTGATSRGVTITKDSGLAKVSGTWNSGTLYTGFSVTGDTVGTANYANYVVTSESNTIKLKPGTYTASARATKATGASGLTVFFATLSSVGGTIASGTGVIASSYGDIINSTKTWTFTLTEEAYFYCGATLTVASNGTAVNVEMKAQLEVGSAATSFEPYAATTYPISWQTEAGTVYGGTLDAVSGVLTVDKAIVDMGTLAWQSASGAFYALISDKAVGNFNLISSEYATATASTVADMGDYQIKGHATTGTIYVKDSRYTVSADFKTAVAGQTVCYELATPQTYQLTGAEVRTIAGYNQIYSDAGQVIDIKF